MPAISGREKVTENARRLLAFSKIVDVPIILTEQEKLGPTLPELKQEVPDLPALSKVHFNCFYSEAFSERVHTSGRRTLIIAGVEAHICVVQTALFAIENYSVHVVADAVSSRTAENCSLAIERMRAKGVTISSTEMVIYEMLQQAGTDEFKAALKLVK